jgi:hypothetical protein
MGVTLKRSIAEFFRDVFFGIRLLAKSPPFTITAVLLLAVGISANTLIFSVVNALLLRSPAVSQPENLVRLIEVHPNDFVAWDLPYKSCDELATRDARCRSLHGRVYQRKTASRGGVGSCGCSARCRPRPAPEESTIPSNAAETRRRGGSGIVERLRVANHRRLVARLAGNLLNPNFLGRHTALAHLTRPSVLIIGRVQFGEVVKGQRTEIDRLRCRLINNDRQPDHLRAGGFHKPL